MKRCFFFTLTMVNQTKFINFKKHLKMKKLFFSAVALIAFSSVSMANTIEIEVVSLDIKEDVRNDYWDCAKIASDVYNEIFELTYSADALLEADKAFEDCMGTNQEPCRPPFIC